MFFLVFGLKRWRDFAIICFSCVCLFLETSLLEGSWKFKYGAIYEGICFSVLAGGFRYIFFFSKCFQRSFCSLCTQADLPFEPRFVQRPRGWRVLVKPKAIELENHEKRRNKWSRNYLQTLQKTSLCFLENAPRKNTQFDAFWKNPQFTLGNRPLRHPWDTLEIMPS